MLLQNGIVYYEGEFQTGRNISICKDVICESSFDNLSLDCTDLYILPGLIDIHTHGALGYDALDGTNQAIDGIAKYMLKCGVTTFLPTVMTGSYDQMHNAICKIRQFKGDDHSADIPGVYMEGPYFSSLKAGAQHPDHIRDISLSEFENDLCSGFVKVISIAPEKDGSAAFIQKYKSHVKIAVGHTDANYEQMQQAISNGVSLLTHTFNAMNPLHHRDPGPIGAALDSDTYCEFICDGLHLSETIIRLLFKVCPERLVMISDSVRPTGLPDGEYMSGGQKIYLSNGLAKLADGTIAGSTCNLLQGLKNMVKFGVSLEDAVKTATENPAKAVGIFDQYGSIDAGKVANLIILDKQLNLKHVIHRGKLL